MGLTAPGGSQEETLVAWNSNCQALLNHALMHQSFSGPLLAVKTLSMELD
jgi:hypothetical protein